MTSNIDPIELEILRTRLEAVAEQAALAVEHTAVSPAVTESKDYSVTLLDAAGALILGAGTVLYHFGAAAHAVRSTISRHGNTIRPGDVFISNDPHNGGGLHPQDVMVQRPVHLGGRLVAWVGISAHMMDMGGMVMGSFAPHATECYQEALRVPPVRLFRGGEEVTDVWDIFRSNVRLAKLVEMDLRGLVAGCHFANERVSAIVDAVGVDTFERSLAAIRELTEEELHRRVERIADGTYRTTSWTEFDRDFYEIPCTLTVNGGRMTFDFAGASAQTDHFFNSKPYIIASELGVMLANFLAPDLPYNEGIFAVFELRCPDGTIVNCKPPAPIGAAHMHVGLNASTVALAAVHLALGSSPDAPARRNMSGPSGDSAIGNQVWSWALPDGTADAFIALDGNWVGGPAGGGRDGRDLMMSAVGSAARGAFADVEVLESWFPLLFLERRTRAGADGAGTNRAGGGNQFSFRTHGIPAMSGTLFGMRRWLPLNGLAGGQPGACAEFLVHRADGSATMVDVNVSGVHVGDDEWFQIRLPNCGGFGDPLERDPHEVAADVNDDRFDRESADAVYGVRLLADGIVDEPSTRQRRAEIRADRLRRAAPAPRPVDVASAPTPSDPGQPLYPGVVQRGALAVSEASGALLAVAPDHWTDGCPVITERRWDETGPDVVFRTYLDPDTGRALHVEVALGDAPRSFLVNPDRWSAAHA